MVERMPRVLIVHSKEDRRIPVSQAMAFRLACREKGVEVEMEVYPREGHLVDLLGRVGRFCGGLLS